ncbi:MULTISPECIES: hypothetical protein [unclassified Synechocystis]|nr:MULTISPECIES: hypothetical protein [unclassified Synechocystis]AIE72942.1 hypothetical protein D082_04130 [Synechocystis sp. PCC 6714]MCT0252581.1 hypothetical protein [Synechocystis sp. CS-94]
MISIFKNSPQFLTIELSTVTGDRQGQGGNRAILELEKIDDGEIRGN